MHAPASNLIRRVLALACAVLLAAGCESMDSLTESVPKPSARVTAARLQGLTLDKVDLVFDVEVSNPYTVNLPLLDLGWAISSRGQQVLAGNLQPKGAIPAQGRRTMRFPASVKFASLLDLLKDLRPGAVVPYTARIDVGVDAPVLGRIALPLSHAGELPVPTVPEVGLDSFQMHTLSLDKVEALARLRVRNTNQFDIDPARLDLHLTLGGQAVAQARAKGAGRLVPDQVMTLELPISFAPKAFGAGLFNLLRGSEAGYGISGSLEAGTRFGPVTLPFSATGKTRLQQ